MKTKKQPQKMECVHCHQDLKNHSFVKINGAYVCLECLKQHYYFCDNCKNWHLKTSEKIKVGSQYYCDTCKNIGIIRVCETCGTWHLTTDLKKVFKKYYCKKCFKYDDAINGYHSHKDYKEPIFNGSGPLYFGLELENYNIHGLSDDEQKYVAGQIIDTIGADHIYNEKDGSLRGCGFETITQPHTMEEFEKIDFAKVCDILKTYNYCEKHENIGLHLHFSRCYLTETQIDLLVYFYSKHFETFKKLSGRINAGSVQSWAQVNLFKPHIALLQDATSETEFLSMLKNYVRRTGDRYQAINLTNSKTIEFRLGAGTTDYNKIKFWIDLHYTIYKNAKNINVNNLNDLDAWFSGRNDLLEAFKAA